MSILKWTDATIINRKASLCKKTNNYITGLYVYSVHIKRNRFLIFKIKRCLDLEIETCRWRGINKNDEICTLCNGEIENKIHFSLL